MQSYFVSYLSFGLLPLGEGNALYVVYGPRVVMPPRGLIGGARVPLSRVVLQQAYIKPVIHVHEAGPVQPWDVTHRQMTAL